MTAGVLKWQVRFDQKIAVDDPYGGTTSEWQPQFTRWAEIRPLKGSEPVIAQRLTGIQPVLIIVRSDTETRQITPAWRAVELDRGEEVRFYGLKTAEDMERARKYITMIAEAGASDGK